MSTQKNKEFVSQFFADFNKVGVDAVKIRACAEKYLAPGFVYHHLGNDINLQQWREFVFKAWSAYPEASFSIDDMVVEGDKVVVRFTFSGISDGKPFSAKGVEIERIGKGRILDTWDFWDPIPASTGFV